jgi:fatty acid desaturase
MFGYMLASAANRNPRSGNAGWKFAIIALALLILVGNWWHGESLAPRVLVIAIGLPVCFGAFCLYAARQAKRAAETAAAKAKAVEVAKVRATASLRAASRRGL